MGIIEEQIKRDKKVKAAKDLAQEIYDNQLKAITGISHTDGYKEIKKYWNSVRESIDTNLKTCSKDELTDLQTKFRIADDFLTFLNNLETAKEKRAHI